MPAPAHLLLGRAAAAGGFDPLSISGCELWLDADDDATFTYSTGVVVSQWDDKSGNDRHVSQSLPGKRPSRSGTQNSLDTVVFDGGDCLRTGSSSSIAQPHTVLIVARNSDLTAGAYGRGISGYSGLGYQLLLGGTTNPPDQAGGIFAGSGVVLSGSGSIVNNTHHQITFTVNGASSVVRVDGSAGSTGNPGSEAFTLATIGARGDEGFYLTGQVAEVLVYSSALSSGDRDDVEAYLAGKWGT
jgi:hypothetical protein